MNAEHLKVATGLQNKEKHPIVADSYILVSGTKDGKVEGLLDKSFLDATRKGSTTRIVGSTLLSGMTYPCVRDRVKSGDLHVHGWLYYIESGEIKYYDPDEHDFLALKK